MQHILESRETEFVRHMSINVTEAKPDAAPVATHSNCHKKFSRKLLHNAFVAFPTKIDVQAEARRQTLLAAS